MKVIYKSVGQEIRDALYNADKRNRTIEKIELTRSEARELLDDYSNWAGGLQVIQPGPGWCKYMGVHCEWPA